MKAVTLLLLSGIGVGLLGASSALAAPANGAVINEAATASEVTQKVLWRGRGVGWRGVGWRGVGWRGRGVGWRGGWGWRHPGWRTGWGWRRGWGWGWPAAGLATDLAIAATAPAWDYGYYGWSPGWAGWGPSWGWGGGWSPGWRVGWRPGWRVGWRPGWRVAYGW